MDEKQWRKEIKSYTSPEQVAIETLKGIDSHLSTCNTDDTQTVAVVGNPHGVPFTQQEMICQRGTRGCGREHNDHIALQFAKIGLEGLIEQLQNSTATTN